MFRQMIIIILAIFSIQPCYSAPSDNKTVLLAILARNKEHTIPKYLECINNLNYDKSLIHVYINTNNNVDTTKELLEAWVEKNKHMYRGIDFECADRVIQSASTSPHVWTAERFKLLGSIRNKSLRKTTEHKTDYYFVVDCDNFIAPDTLKILVNKDKPIIAPMLGNIPNSKSYYSNFFYAVNENGYYEEHEGYYGILRRTHLGTFKVPVVHCTYLIQSEYVNKLGYIDDTNDYEFVIFSRFARKNHINQFICNEINFGTQLHFATADMSLEEEKAQFLEYLNSVNGDVLNPR